jgi:hypothetical protein
LARQVRLPLREERLQEDSDMKEQIEERNTIDKLRIGARGALVLWLLSGVAAPAETNATRAAERVANSWRVEGVGPFNGPDDPADSGWRYTSGHFAV